MAGGLGCPLGFTGSCGSIFDGGIGGFGNFGLDIKVTTQGFNSRFKAHLDFGFFNFRTT